MKHNMSVQELARWACLIEAIDIVDEQYRTENKKFISNNLFFSKLKESHIRKYIEDRYPSMVFHFKQMNKEKVKDKKQYYFSLFS